MFIFCFGFGSRYEKRNRENGMKAKKKDLCNFKTRTNSKTAD